MVRQKAKWAAIHSHSHPRSYKKHGRNLGSGHFSVCNFLIYRLLINIVE